jgi:Flp pilus assembly protein TadD
MLVQAYQAATELSPQHATAYFNLGVAYAARGPFSKPRNPTDEK